MKRVILAVVLATSAASTASADEPPKNYLGLAYGQMLGECLQSRGADVAKAMSLVDENVRLKAQVEELTKRLNKPAQPEPHTPEKPQ